MTFELNPAGLLELLNGDEARAFVTDVARRAAGEAERIAQSTNAPVDYKRSIGSTEAEATSEGARATVYSDSSFWHWPEFGTVHMPPSRPLTSGVISTGIEFTESDQP
jgi:hypothetical protein